MTTLAVEIKDMLKISHGVYLGISLKLPTLEEKSRVI